MLRLFISINWICFNASICSGGDGGGASDRVINQILTEMDGMGRWAGLHFFLFSILLVFFLVHYCEYCF